MSRSEFIRQAKSNLESAIDDELSRLYTYEDVEALAKKASDALNDAEFTHRRCLDIVADVKRELNSTLESVKREIRMAGEAACKQALMQDESLRLVKEFMENANALLAEADAIVKRQGRSE